MREFSPGARGHEPDPTQPEGVDGGSEGQLEEIKTFTNKKTLFANGCMCVWKTPSWEGQGAIPWPATKID